MSMNPSFRTFVMEQLGRPAFAAEEIQEQRMIVVF